MGGLFREHREMVTLDEKIVDAGFIDAWRDLVILSGFSTTLARHPRARFHGRERAAEIMAVALDLNVAIGDVK